MAAITTGMLIAAGIKAGTDIYAAHKANKANEKALAQQTAANDKALAATKAAHEESNAALRPFVAGGTAGFQTLGHAMGLNPVPVGGPGSSSSSSTSTSSTGTGRTAPAGSSDLGFAGPRPGGGKTLGESDWAPLVGKIGQGASSLSTRKMKAPTGEVQEVPAEAVPYYSSLGATEVR